MRITSTKKGVKTRAHFRDLLNKVIADIATVVEAKISEEVQDRQLPISLLLI